MKTIILSAGRGSRLLPLTEHSPKCLLPVDAEHTILSWQLSRLARAGAREAVVVAGFRTDAVERHVAGRTDLPVRLLHNPFYDIADNLSSVWCAAPEMNEDFLLLNGDTLFTDAVAERLLASRAAITMTIARKPRYDADDMKVCLRNDKVVAVGKTLDPAAAQGEAIGMTLVRGHAVDAFAAAVLQCMRRPDARALWYTSVLDDLARRRGMATSRAGQDEWCEVDEPADLEHARAAVQSWRTGWQAVQLATGS